MLKNPDVLASYDQAPQLVWSARYIGDPDRGLDVSWKVTDPSLVNKIGKRVRASITDILDYLHVGEEFRTDYGHSNRIEWFEESRPDFLEYFSNLTTLIGKPIKIYRYIGSTGDSVFLFRCDPNMTPEIRGIQMHTLLNSASALLLIQDNISQVWGYGSVVKNKPYPTDVDIAVISRRLSPQHESSSYSDYFSLFVPDKNRGGLCLTDVVQDLRPEVVSQLTQMAELVGVRIHMSAIAPDIFSCPTLGAGLGSMIKEIKNGKLF